jgi:hypothetical protein
MAIKRKTPFGKLVPEDIKEMFAELKLEVPNPLWYVGRLDERGAKNSRPTNGHGANGNGATQSSSTNGNGHPPPDDE